MRLLLLSILPSVALGAGSIWMLYQHDLRAIRAFAAMAGRVETASGRVAYATGGHGKPVLVIHGAEGGHDQGRLLAKAFLLPGHHWVSPSRFGYPGSPMPANSSTAAQADAFADLLDALKIDRVVVLAMSGGVPPALQFAIRYPSKTEALALLSLSPYAPLTAKEQELPVPLWLYDRLFASDFPLWAVMRVAPHALALMFDVRDDLIPHLRSDEKVFVDKLIAAFLPVTERREGLANEGAAIDPASQIDPSAITAPVLVVHALDDRITPFSTASFTAEHMSGAELVVLQTGGHLLLGHHAQVRARIAGFLSARAPKSNAADAKAKEEGKP